MLARQRPVQAAQLLEAQLLEPLEPRTLLAGDHPSLVDLPTSTTITLVDNFHNQSAIGQAYGTIGTVGDDDLFSFVAPYTARTAIVVSQLAVGGLAPAIQLFDDAGQPLSVLADGWDGIAAVPPVPLTIIQQGETYFINVRAGNPSDTNEAEITGGYFLVIVMELPAESHKGPGGNEPVALPIDDNTGRGDARGFISDAETDEFFFAPLADGEVSLSITTPGSNLDAEIEVVDEFGAPVATGTGDGQTTTVAFQAVALRQYTARVRADSAAGANADSGAYAISVLAAVPGTPDEPPVDQQLSEAEMAGAERVAVDLMSGFASTTDTITADTDSDVFTFRALRTGSATVVIERSAGTQFDSVLDVFRDQSTRMAFDATGGQAWIGRVTFEVIEGSDYYIRVRGRDGETGGYTLRAASPLSEYVLMYPEGYSTGTIDEYVPLVNPNPYPVNYTITARYEVGDRDQVIAAGTVPASSRGGVTITSQRAPGASLVRTDTPYALEIRSDGQLGATLSHYDFGVTTGESFTNRRSPVWVFGEANRDAARYRDFLVFYNPTPSAAVVTVSLVYDDGEVVSFTRTLDAFRRGGVNFTNDTAITRDGSFSVRVNSDQPIVAALSSYDIIDQRGFGLLGDADAGSTRGAIPLFAGDAGARPSVSVFNPAGIPATVRFTTTLVGIQPPTVVREIVIPANSRRAVTSDDLGFDQDVLAGLEYTSNLPVVVSSSEYHTGDGDSTSAATAAVASSIIADAFVNPDGAGTTYRELLSVYNPWETPTQISVTLLREGGVLDSLTITVAARGFSFVRIDQMPGVLAHTGPVAFSIRIDGAAPVVASFMHYDLFLDGGWGALAAPLGLTTPLGAL